MVASNFVPSITTSRAHSTAGRAFFTASGSSGVGEGEGSGLGEGSSLGEGSGLGAGAVLGAALGEGAWVGAVVGAGVLVAVGVLVGAAVAVGAEMLTRLISCFTAFPVTVSYRVRLLPLRVKL